MADVTAKKQVHAQRKARLEASQIAPEDDLLPDAADVEVVEESDDPGRKRKLKADEIGISEDRDEIRIGMTPQARRVITWHAGADQSLLIAGYGVPHTSYLLQSIIGHYQAFKVPLYGIDNMDMIAGYKKGTFAELVTYRRPEAVEMLERLVKNEGEQTLVLTNLGSFLNPPHSTMSTDAQATLRQDIINLLLRMIRDDHTHVIISTSKLLHEADLPTELIEAFTNRAVVGRVFANEVPRLLDEREQKQLDKASIWHSLLHTPDGAQVFQHSRPGLLRNY